VSDQESSESRHTEGREPTVDQPLNAEPRPRVKPLLLLLAFVVALALVFFLGYELLIPAD
jgi:hypothetical protein